jgi:hypothetical protein
LKIVINGAYGKFGDYYSMLYSPKSLIQTTIAGQLYQLMIIERLELAGVSVVSANTDGFVSLVDDDHYLAYNQICNTWQKHTNLVLETTEYKSLFSRDVNSYMAIKLDNSYKVKGAMAYGGLTLNPQMNICNIAIVNLLTNNIGIEKTILENGDIKNYLTVRKVTSGATCEGEYIGKVVRWYYSKDGKCLKTADKGNLVPDSTGAKPMMLLCDTLPTDIDYGKYISQTYKLMRALGL